MAASKNSAVPGGYDYDYVDTPPDRVICKVCQMPCREAHISECCGHVFCKSDIETMKANQHIIHFLCPVCRCDATKFIIQPELEVDREIKALKIRCPSKSDGCGWIGEVRNVDKHLKGQITCSKCDQVVDHGAITNHLTSECPCYCQYCKVTAERIVIADQHKKNCHRFPVSCPNNCGAEGITRSELDNHKRVCPLEIINCNECGTKIARKDEKSHNEEYMTKHGSIIRNRLQTSYIDSVDNMQEDVQAFVNQAVDRIQAQVLDLNATMNALPNEINTYTGEYCFWVVLVLTCLILAAISMVAIDNQTVVDKTLADQNIVQKHLSELHDKIDGLGSEIATIIHAQAMADSKLNKMVQHFEKQQLPSLPMAVDNVHLDKQVAPVAISMPKFSEKLNHKKTWHSSPFLAFWNGYQMCLVVEAAGNGEGESTHVSVFLKVMKGPYDDELEESGRWPVKGIFVIKLIDQLNNSDHLAAFVIFDGAENDAGSRVVNGDIAHNGWGIPQFISHDNISHQSNSKYVKSDTLSFSISYADTDMNQDYPATPVILSLHNLTRKVHYKHDWFSSRFLAFWRGYQMCLRVNVTGDSIRADISVFLHLMKGPYDDELEQSGHWPVRGTFMIELLDQLGDNDHRVTYITFDNANVEVRSRVIDNDVAINGWGIPKFASFDFRSNSSKYLQNNTLCFRILYMDTYQHNLVAPVILKLDNFTEKMKHKEKWFSNYFFAFWRGYQMCLAVDVAGAGIGRGTHLSVYLHLMKGPYDDELEQSGHWPLTGTFTIELLNQLDDNDHRITYVLFDDMICKADIRKRVVDGSIAITGFGEPRFISHDALSYQNNTKYAKNNTLYFRVSYLVANHHYDITPTILTMHNFAEKIKNNDSWFSSPFFAFWRGYQLCLLVKFTEDNSTDDYLSVYLHLMKGPYDDELEQSGHWPVRGTFKIELLNQLSDRDHHAAYTSYDSNTMLNHLVGKRVEGSNIAPHAFANVKVIRKDILLNQSSIKYIKNDTLHFMISYVGEHQHHYYIAPIILKMSNFAERMNDKSRWLSSPFFAFWRGIRVRLSVDAADTNENGTYLSVYIQLMKGPYDHELEQSGQWPVRGTFTIEILNQLSDTDHYANCLPFAGARLLWDEISPLMFGKQFMSHDNLLYQSKGKYVVNNTLYFKVSFYH